MHITVLMVLTYIACCVRIGTAPWKYFQLNARYFSGRDGIFSKLAIDRLIPERWHLAQTFDAETPEPARYPVFLKPEWGQNAHGILRADSPARLRELRLALRDEPRRYLLQEAARGAREFEIFMIDAPHSGHTGTPSADDSVTAEARDARGRRVITVTEAVNPSEHYPINSKYNRDTRYVDITDQFSLTMLDQLGSYVREVGHFGIARMSARCNSIADLVDGEFQVIEINLFLPMPINLLDEQYTWQQRLRFIGSTMLSLAYATRAIQPVSRQPWVFTQMMLYGRRQRSASQRPGQLKARRSLS